MSPIFKKTRTTVVESKPEPPAPAVTPLERPAPPAPAPQSPAAPAPVLSQLDRVEADLKLIKRRLQIPC